MTQKKKETYDYICFTDLAYEFAISDRKDVEKKIKRRLKYYDLGDYDQKRVEYIRKLKNELVSEIRLTTKSRYFNKSKSEFADLADFDTQKMKVYFLDKFNEVSEPDMEGILNFAIYIYYLR